MVFGAEGSVIVVSDDKDRRSSAEGRRSSEDVFMMYVVFVGKNHIHVQATGWSSGQAMGFSYKSAVGRVMVLI